jgi:methionine-R-sulfoxide reductase
MNFLVELFLLLGLIPIAMVAGKSGDDGDEKGDAEFEVKKTEGEWRAQLTDQQYEVTRNKATERAFTGAYWDTKDEGVYRCVGCDAELYKSEAKFDAGCGWPSYTLAASDGAVVEESDDTAGMRRTEILCSKCGAHLGHVFNDGPQPTGMRHCVNSASIKLEPKSE